MNGADAKARAALKVVAADKLKAAVEATKRNPVLTPLRNLSNSALFSRLFRRLAEKDVKLKLATEGKTEEEVEPQVPMHSKSMRGAGLNEILTMLLERSVKFAKETHDIRLAESLLRKLNKKVIKTRSFWLESWKDTEDNSLPLVQVHDAEDELVEPMLDEEGNSKAITGGFNTYAVYTKEVAVRHPRGSHRLGQSKIAWNTSVLKELNYWRYFAEMGIAPAIRAYHEAPDVKGYRVISVVAQQYKMSFSELLNVKHAQPGYEAMVREVCHQIIELFYHMTDLGFVNVDMKPPNIVLNPAPDVKDVKVQLIDFDAGYTFSIWNDPLRDRISNFVDSPDACCVLRLWFLFLMLWMLHGYIGVYHHKKLNSMVCSTSQERFKDEMKKLHFPIDQILNGQIVDNSSLKAFVKLAAYYGILQQKEPDYQIKLNKLKISITKMLPVCNALQPQIGDTPFTANRSTANEERTTQGAAAPAGCAAADKKVLSYPTAHVFVKSLEDLHERVGSVAWLTGPALKLSDANLAVAHSAKAEAAAAATAAKAAKGIRQTRKRRSPSPPQSGAKRPFKREAPFL